MPKSSSPSCAGRWPSGPKTSVSDPPVGGERAHAGFGEGTRSAQARVRASKVGPGRESPQATHCALPGWRLRVLGRGDVQPQGSPLPPLAYLLTPEMYWTRELVRTRLTTHRPRSSSCTSLRWSSTSPPHEGHCVHLQSTELGQWGSAR